MPEIKISEDFLREFIYESNLIDPQPGHENEPGDPHYDDHLAAAKMAVNFADMNVIAPPNVIHEKLMRRLKGMRKHAGKLRTVDVMVGNRICPEPEVIPRMLREWNGIVRRYIESNLTGPNGICWDLHVRYEHIHPWIDGNGRSGRLLMLNHRLLLGLEPIIVRYAERFDYYNRF
jgi:hypothetical protein